MLVVLHVLQDHEHSLLETQADLSEKLLALCCLGHNLRGSSSVRGLQYSSFPKGMRYFL